MTIAPARPGLGRLVSAPGLLALVSLAAASWLLVALARGSWFGYWWAATPFLLAAAVLGGMAWWQSGRFDRLAALLLIGVAALLYLPPGQHLGLSGGAAIYANEGIWLARTGGLVETYAPLTPLSEATRDLFFISSDEQATIRGGIQAYKGLIYRGYYVVDEEPALIHASRMPQVPAWIAYAARLGGTRAGFYVSYVAAALALCLLYAAGARLYSRWIALWVALLVAICYPQVYLARAPLAEIAGQFWTLAGLYVALRWLEEGTPWLLPLTLLLWVTSWSARIDSLLLLAPAGLLLLVAAWRRDGVSLIAAGLAMPVLGALVVLGNNPIYATATLEISATYLDPLIPGLVGGAVAAPLAIAALWRWRAPLAAFWRQARWPVSLVIFAASAFVVLWSTLPNPWRAAEVTRSFQEIIWFSSAYVTPLFYWTALAGLGLVLWRGRRAGDFYLAALIVALGAAYFYTYTSARVYPVSMRRLVGDVIPLAALMCGYALALLPEFKARAWVQGALAAVLLLWMQALASPLLRQHEASHELAFVTGLHAQLPENGVFLFEPQDEDSWIGWLAAPLYSLYGDWALLLESDTPEPALLAQAVGELEAAGRDVYLVTQSEPAPPPLVPAGFVAQPVLQTEWASSIIGQTRDPYPPPYWEFRLPLRVYRLAAER